MSKKDEFTPVKCPPGCAYAMTDHGEEHCGFVLLANQSRGCDPGPGCKRYRKGHHHPPTPMRVKDPARKRARVTQEPKPKHHPAPGWDVVRGRELWQQGMTNHSIAAELGISVASVQRRKARYWRMGVD